MMKMTMKLMLLALCLSILCACTQAHTHEAVEGWDRDLEQHWKVCACGEKLEAAEHTLDDENLCTVCGSECIDYGGSGGVYNYDAYGNIIRMTDYDEDGKLLMDDVREHTYDADGNLTESKYYDGDRLYQQDYFAQGAYGEWIVVKSINFSEGAKTESEYDENGGIVADRYYENDALVSETSYENEYAVADDGYPRLAKVTIRHSETGMVEVMEYDYNDRILLHHVVDADGEDINYQAWEYDVDEDGNLMAQREYDRQGLVRQEEYGWFEDGDGSAWSYIQVLTEYAPDGSKVVMELDEYEEPISITEYDAEGNIVE
jgi:hypothetical protein